MLENEMWNPERAIPMAHAKPANGSEYSPLELTALMHIPVQWDEVVLGPLSKRWEYFEHASKLDINPHKKIDQQVKERLTRALLAEKDDPAVLTLGDFT